MNPRWVKNAHWIGLLFIVGFMSFYSETSAFLRQTPRAQAVLCFGFLLLSGYLFGELTRHWRLPALTGYLAAGILFGPQVVGLISGPRLVGELTRVDELALTFIALTVGGELHLRALRQRARGVFLAVAAVLLVVIPGVAFGIGLIGQGAFGRAGLLPGDTWIVAGLLGVLSVGPSPATAIALIRETRARGRFTELLLGVTVCLDVLVVVMFAVAMSVAGSLADPHTGLNTEFLFGLGAELLVSLLVGAAAGFLLGRNAVRLHGELAVVILVFCVMVSQATHTVSQLVEAHFHVHFQLEPVLVCMAAGVVIQNATRSGHRFMEEMERISLPIYIVFFAILGVRLDLLALADTWGIAVGVLVIRLALLGGAGWVGGWAAGEDRETRKWLGAGLVTQAGVSVGLALLISERFPEWGNLPATLALAVIGLNQLVGPILLKVSLERSGETARRSGLGGKLEAIRRRQRAGSDGG